MALRAAYIFNAAALILGAEAAHHVDKRRIKREVEGRKLQSRANAWTSDHAGNNNLGMVPGPGPGFFPGVCKEDWLDYVPPDPDYPFSDDVYSSGVSSTQESAGVAHTFGDEAGLVWMFSDGPEGFPDDVAIEFPQDDWNVQSLTGLDAITSSPATVYNPLEGQDTIIVPSADGHVYAMSQSVCFAGLDVRARKERAAATRRRAASKRRGASMPSFHRALQGVPTGPGNCEVWMYTSPTAGMFASPPRIAPSLGLVFVSETDPNLATGGVLRALNLSTGAQVWEMNSSMYNDVSYPFIGVLPASSPLSVVPDGNLIMAVGPAILVIDAVLGNVLASIDTTAPNGPCPSTGELFASSVGVAEAGPYDATIFVQSLNGHLWSYNLNDPGDGALSFTCKYACSYKGGQPVCGDVTVPEGQQSNAAGGWYQPTTPTQRDELHAAIRAKHAQLFGGPVISSKSVEQMARDIPREHLDALTTPSGYVRLGTHGKPLSPSHRFRDAFGGTYARATPALDPNGNIIAMPTFGDGLTNSDAGVVLAIATNGSPEDVSWFITSVGNDIEGSPVPYARSRSSAAWDGLSVLYVTADWDMSATGSGVGGWNDTLPALIVMDVLTSGTPTLIWGSELGPEGSGSVALISPVLADGVDSSTHRVLAAGTEGAFHAMEGCPTLCPTSNDLMTCSSHGRCDGNSGTCECQPAWSGDDMCYRFTGCDHGLVDQEGYCDCQSCWRTNVNGTCSIPADCLHGGYCEVLGGDRELCLCPYCWGLDQDGLCSVGPTACGNYSTGCAVDSCTCSPCYVPADDGESCVPQPCGYGTCVDLMSLVEGRSVVAAASNAGGPVGSDVDNPICVCDKCYQRDASGSCTAQLDCGQGGICSADEGVCENAGDLCWIFNSTSEKYDTRQACSNRGTCNDATGHCTCTAGWSNTSFPNPCSACDACHSGLGTCATVYTCGGNGVCSVLAGAPGVRMCTCAAGWSGPNCDVSTGDANAGGMGVSPAVAAGVGVPVGLLGAAALGFIILKYRGGAGYGSLGSSVSAGSGAKAGSTTFKAGSGSGGAAAPSTLGGIARTAGLGSDAAKAAVARLSAVTGSSAKPVASDTSALLGNRSKGAYGGL